MKLLGLRIWQGERFMKRLVSGDHWQIRPKPIRLKYFCSLQHLSVKTTDNNFHEMHPRRYSQHTSLNSYWFLVCHSHVIPPASVMSSYCPSRRLRSGPCEVSCARGSERSPLLTRRIRWVTSLAPPSPVTRCCSRYTVPAPPTSWLPSPCFKHVY